MKHVAGDIKHNTGGFTLLEIIISVGLGTFLAVAVAATAIISLQHLKSLTVLERLHSQAIFVSEALSYRIRNSVILDVSSPSTLTIFAPDLSTTTVTLSDNRLTINGSPITSSEVLVTNLSFIKAARSVEVGFTLKAPNANTYFSATTTFAERNFPI